MTFASAHLDEARRIIEALDVDAIERLAALLASLRGGRGRLFLLGVGGSAANCSHAANDFRKIAGIEAYAPTDNVAELTARANDEGWESVFVGWLKASRLTRDDMVFVLSVGGGSVEKNISPNLVVALRYAKEVGARIAGIVGRDGGYTSQVADVCVLVPTVNPVAITPHCEAFQAVIWHLLVSHPNLKSASTKWETATAGGGSAVSKPQAAARAVFLDRDGVINRALVRGGRPFAPSSVDEVDILPGVESALLRLRQAGFRLIIVTNQPEVARGSLAPETADAIHAALRAALPIDEIRVCFHDDSHRCSCRKPAPGLLVQAAADAQLNLASSFMVGDRWRDIEAGQRAGCVSLFIDCGYSEPKPKPPFVRVDSLAAAADWILSRA